MDCVTSRTPSRQYGVGGLGQWIGIIYWAKFAQASATRPGPCAIGSVGWSGWHHVARHFAHGDDIGDQAHALEQVIELAALVDF